jgi:3D (Asp-Asp-Asp) domain-containing protein/peptidoglycan hydrolase CwlO-like protein
MRACRVVSLMATPCQGTRTHYPGAFCKPGMVTAPLDGRQAEPAARRLEGRWYAAPFVDAGARRPWIRFAVGGALALAALVSSSAALADDPSTLRSEIERLRLENDGLAARSQTALLDLYSIETRLTRTEARLAALQARRSSLERQKADAQRSLELARADVREAENRLGVRLSELYVQGEVDPLAVILAAESLDEALSAFDNLTRLADQDHSILLELRNARLELQRSLRTLGERSAALRGVVADVEGEQAALAAARAEREAYVDNLAARRALNARQINRLSDQASAAAAQAPEPAPESHPEPAPDPGPKPGGTHMVVDVVAYCGGVGTASGLPLGWGTVAVDTSVFPFGTRMYIPGYGDGVAADTGTAIIGRIIDIWFPTCGQARAWGRQTLTITVYW